jgi:hypothetical protein
MLQPTRPVLLLKSNILLHYNGNTTRSPAIWRQNLHKLISIKAPVPVLVQHLGISYLSNVQDLQYQNTMLKIQMYKFKLSLSPKQPQALSGKDLPVPDRAAE